MAYEMKHKLRRDDHLTVVDLGSTYSFVPSNPWIAVGWRQPQDIKATARRSTRTSCFTY